MTALRVQGAVFCLLAFILAGATATGAVHVPDGTAGVLLAVPVVVLGVPHGALDTVFARGLYGVHGLRGWTGFALAYLGAALLVLLAWRSVPSLALSGFLLLSVLHFSGDPAPGTGLVVRLLYGGAPIVLPALLHAGEVTRLFAMLVPAPDATTLVVGLHALSGPWLLATIVVLGITLQQRRQWLTGGEVAGVAALALLLPPLPAFALFFCIMHSARHVVRTWQYAGAGVAAAGQLGRAALLPLLGTLVLGGLFHDGLRAQPVEAGLMQLLFIGMAALTVPHMALVEQARWSGWTNRHGFAHRE